MNTLLAFSLGAAHRHDEQKVFDWVKAARLIMEHKAYKAFAGLMEDWEETSDLILDDGKPAKDIMTYLASTWATPTIILYYPGRCESFECFRMQYEVPQYDADTKWPKEALEILEGAKDEE